MKYCTKCKKLYKGEKTEKCPNCLRKLIDNAAPSSPVSIVTANGFELERIRAALEDVEIPYSYQQIKNDTGIQILNSAPFENCAIYVPLSAYYDAVNILAGIGALSENEITDLDEEERKNIEKAAKDEELSPEKAKLIRYLSFAGFIALLAGVIYLTDFLMSLLGFSNT